MSLPDYELHLDRNRFNSLWDDDESSVENFPFGEDMSIIDKIIEEEIGPSRRRRRKKEQK